MYIVIIQSIYLRMRSPEINYVNAALKIYDDWKVNYQMKDHLKIRTKCCPLERKLRLKGL